MFLTIFPLALAGLGAGLSPQESELDELVIRGPGTRITRSCTVRLPGRALRDRSGKGAVRIVGDGLVVDFAGEHLGGAPAKRTADEFEGVGIWVRGRDITLRNARVSGYKIGIRASASDGLVLEDCDVSGNFRQRLASTPQAESDSDWLWPHENDDNEWAEKYGAGVWIEDSNDVTVRRSRARAGQNGLILDRVNDSRCLRQRLLLSLGLGTRAVALEPQQRSAATRSTSASAATATACTTAGRIPPGSCCSSSAPRT